MKINQDNKNNQDKDRTCTKSFLSLLYLLSLLSFLSLSPLLSFLTNKRAFFPNAPFLIYILFSLLIANVKYLIASLTSPNL